MIVEVALNIPLQQTFDYLWCKNFKFAPQLGLRVLVPFGSQKKTGIVVKIKEYSDFDQLKKIEIILDETPTFHESLLHFTKWASQYYVAGWGELLACAIPGGLNLKTQKTYSLQQPPNPSLLHAQRPELQNLLKKTTWTIAHWQKIHPTSKEQKLFNQWITQGIIQETLQTKKMTFKPKLEKWVCLTENTLPITHKKPKKQTKRDKLLQLLQDEQQMPVATIKNHIPAPSQVLKQLKEENLITFFEKEIPRQTKPQNFQQEPFQTLNHEQTQAFENIQHAINVQKFKVYLLQGITGSGKTEVYLHATQHALARGKTCLALVPEIPLTYTFVSHFQARFGSQVAVLHSGMSDSERFDEWYQVKTGKCPIVIGTRSAIFAPLENIGLIIVDEEHDTSYKQGESPRYNARDLAVIKAKNSHAVLILGSATPSLESYYNVQQGKYERLILSHRASHAHLPTVHFVDLKREKRQSGCYFFSEKLVEEIRKRLKNNEQSLLFLNRRGFSPLLECQNCLWSATCENCSLALIYHQSNVSLQCHQCHYYQKMPPHCPMCHSHHLRQIGTGTEQIEEKLKMIFPEARLLRMDRDALKGKNALENAIEKIKALKVDIIIGTQIVTKGHDFPNLTLVGVLLADMSLNFPDFRAAERTFQILTQVEGRAGRSKKAGLALIQTYNPAHHSLQCAKEHDVEKFLQQELEFRIALESPPLRRVALLLVSSLNEAQAQLLCTQCYQILSPYQTPSLQISQPTPSPIAKINKHFRWQLFITAQKPFEIQNLLSQMDRKSLKSLKKQDRIHIDIDPYHML